MKEVKKIINASIWYVQRPHLIPQIYFTFKNRYFPHKKEFTSNEMNSYCKKNSISVKQFLKELKIIDLNFKSKFKEELNKAKIRQEECPIKMGGPGDLELLYNICEHYKIENVIETGVAYGWSSFAILLSLEHRNNSKLISIDMPYLFRDNDSYVGYVIPKKLKYKWKLLRYADRQGIPKALKILPKLDMCHYDSDKSYTGRMWAYPKLWNKLKKNGVFISDDIGDNIAFLDFAKKVNKKPYIIKSGNKFVGVLIK